MSGVRGRRVVLTSNGPGELYTWARPVVDAWRRAEPDADLRIALVPCQFAAGGEPAIARTFAVDGVTTVAQFVTAAATGGAPPGLAGGPGGLVVSLGGAGAHAVSLARRLGVPAFKYAFVPARARGLERLFVHDEATRRKARLLGVPGSRVEVVGNLVADAVHGTEAVVERGDPHVVLMAGSRDGFALHLIPLVLAVADRLAAAYPGARFVWPVPRLLRPETVAAGLAGVERATFGGTGARRDGARAVTEAGTVVELVDEAARYAHMRAADVALTIPGTNTLELGIAGVPSVVVLPLNRPEAIPLEGPGHWLSLIPWIGVPLKRRAVRLFVQGMNYPVSLPNQFSGEALMDEIKGIVDPDTVAARVATLLDDPEERARRRERLRATMPGPGAADALVARLRALAGDEG